MQQIPDLPQLPTPPETASPWTKWAIAYGNQWLAFLSRIMVIGVGLYLLDRIPALTKKVERVEDTQTKNSELIQKVSKDVSAWDY